MSKILILGAGIFQVPLIEKVKEKGHKAFVASISGNYPGIHIADKYCEVDITNSEKIVSLVKKYKIDAVVTSGSDVGVPTIGLLTDKLGFIGPSYSIANTVSKKSKFREFQKCNDLNYPNFVKGTCFSEFKTFIKSQNKNFVFKPDDSSGSRGVSIINKNDSEQSLFSKFKLAKNKSRNGIVCAESFIEGVEYGGDGFICDGRLVFFTTTQKHLNGTIVVGHSIPSNLNEFYQLEVKSEIEETCLKLGYNNGPINFDVFITAHNVIILEMGLRSGGNGIVDIIEYGYGINMNELLIDYINGDEPVIMQEKINYEVSSFIFGSKTEGLLKSIDTFTKLSGKIPELISMKLAIKEGEKVKKFSDNSNLIGYVLIKSSLDSYNEITKNVLNELNIKVVES